MGANLNKILVIAAGVFLGLYVTDYVNKKIPTGDAA
jgi:hypothetical protein